MVASLVKILLVAVQERSEAEHCGNSESRKYLFGDVRFSLERTRLSATGSDVRQAFVVMTRFNASAFSSDLMGGGDWHTYICTVERDGAVYFTPTPVSPTLYCMPFSDI